MKNETKLNHKKMPALQMEVGGSWITIRIKGDSEICSECGREIEVFNEAAAKARFLIVREADQIYLGGGRCLECKRFVCIRCAAKTVYGEGMYRLHCPQCGKLLSGLRTLSQDDTLSFGAFLKEPDFAAPAEDKASPS